jgi:hypothetical protein
MNRVKKFVPFFHLLIFFSSFLSLFFYLYTNGAFPRWLSENITALILSIIIRKSFRYFSKRNLELIDLLWKKPTSRGKFEY